LRPVAPPVNPVKVVTHPDAHWLVPVNEAVDPLTEPAVIGDVSEGRVVSPQEEVTPARESPMMTKLVLLAGYGTFGPPPLTVRLIVETPGVTTMLLSLELRVRPPVREFKLDTPELPAFAITKASVAILAVLSPTVCVVPVIPLAKAPTPMLAAGIVDEAVSALDPLAKRYPVNAPAPVPP